MSRTMCKRVKEGQLISAPHKYLAHSADPKHVCRHCGRLADKAKSLCKPERISKLTK
jgi:hypothetical protein